MRHVGDRLAVLVEELDVAGHRYLVVDDGGGCYQVGAEVLRIEDDHEDRVLRFLSHEGGVSWDRVLLVRSVRDGRRARARHAAATPTGPARRPRAWTSPSR